MSKIPPDGPASARPRYEARLLVLVGVLGTALGGYAVNNLIGIPLIPIDDGSPTRRETAAYEAKVLPSQDQILAYLDGNKIRSTDAQGGSPPDAVSLALRKGSIAGLKISRGDHFFTLATFTLDTDRGPYAVEVLVNHNPTDGTFAFRGFRVQKACRE